MKPSDPLKDVLQKWQVAPSRDPEFRAAVWRRIARKAPPQGIGVFIRTRATYLAAAAAVIITISGWTGHSVARAQAQADRSALATTYLAGLDARVQAGIQE